MRLTVIIPCYLEAETIESVTQHVVRSALPEGWSKEIIIVDDGSDSETIAALARVEAAHGSDVQVVYRGKNGGKGAAVKDGLRKASGDYVLIQDADSEYDPSEYMKLVLPVHEGTGETVFGSRSLGRNNVPFNKIYFYGGLLVTRVYNILFAARLTDIASCYKVFSARHIPQLLRSSHDDFVFDAVDLTHVLVQSGAIVEVPISYTARSKETGKKLNWRHGIDIVIALFLTRVGVPLDRRAGAAKIVRFLIAGGLAMVVNIALLYVFTEFLGMWYLVSAGLAFMCAFVVSFTLQKYWAFRNNDVIKVRTQLPMHLTVALVNLVIDIALVYMLVELLGVWYIAAQIIAAAVISIESFFAFRWIYR